MDEERSPQCPRCAGETILASNGKGASVPRVWVECESCDWPGPVRRSEVEAIEACRNLCYLDQRSRLPTPEEEAAHRARHGGGAGWMVRAGQYGQGAWWNDLAPADIEAWRCDLSRPNSMGKAESYPHVDGRPVAGPEGW